ncbi:ubiquinol-cytochrome c reductase iron-sulfur subunit [Actinophytocola glycyrrhizae]|uniref:Cytochrome bc1 complex Rieske iron-sulfur subunit n=1 Tax=Actinophytocola glycyrrhizae TaxID=2044873 RepID=A0ABV9RZK7_9PSEU
MPQPDHDEDARSGERQELVRYGAEQDGVRLRKYADPWPVAGTRAERRARRLVLTWAAVSVLSGLSFLAAYVFWPSRYVPPGEDGHLVYVLYTPMLGLTLGLALIALSVMLIVYTRRFMPREVAVQERHDEPSPEADQDATAAILADSARRAGLTRRSWMGRALGAGVGVTGLGAGVLTVGGFVEDPVERPRDPDSLWHTTWASTDGEQVYLRQDLGDPHEVVLVRPADLEAGSTVGVVPFRESERDDPERLVAAARRADAAAMLFRLRPEERVVPRPGHEGFNYGSFYAYSRICTHLGCPVSLFETRVSRLLCPCHQSQFDLNRGAVPIFGPAVRALPQLPITLAPDGFLVATGDFLRAGRSVVLGAGLMAGGGISPNLPGVLRWAEDRLRARRGPPAGRCSPRQATVAWR